MNKSQSRISSITNSVRASLGKKKTDQKEVTDVCVIGSGAGGAVVAKELAEAGLSVIILEAGEDNDPSTFGTYEPEMLRRLFWDSGLRCTRDGAIIISQGRGVGGSTVHNLCYAIRPPQAVLHRWRVPEVWSHFDQVEADARCYTDARDRRKPIKCRYPQRMRSDEVARWAAKAQSRCLSYVWREVSFWMP